MIIGLRNDKHMYRYTRLALKEMYLGIVLGLLTLEFLLKSLVLRFPFKDFLICDTARISSPRKGMIIRGSSRLDVQNSGRICHWKIVKDEYLGRREPMYAT